MTSTKIRTQFAAMHGNPLYRVPLLNTTLGNVISAMSKKNWTTVTGGLDHRGLHWTDKRFTELTGITFIKSCPNCSLFEILDSNHKAAQAVKSRSKSSKKINSAQYMQSLVIRNLRGQIQNPVLRHNYAQKLMETLRSTSQRWVRLAMNPRNAQTAATQILFN